MAEIYDYYPQSIQDYIAQFTQQEPPPSGSGPQRRRASSNSWDDAIGEAGEIADEVFEAFAEQARSAVSSRISKEALFHTSIFACKLALYVIVRIGSDHGLYGHF